MKKILVPCDFSSTATNAFRLACEIAAKSKGQVFLLNVVEMPVINNHLVVTMQAFENSYFKEVKQKASINFEKMKAKWGGKVKTHLTVDHGTVVGAINKFVAKKKIDLVIMGTHGSRGFWEYAIGSNAEKVVQNCKVPVMAVKKVQNASSIKDIVFPTNLVLDQEKLVSAVKALQAFFKARLHILYVNTPAHFSRDTATEKSFQRFTSHFQLKHFTVNIFNDIDEEEGIIHFSSRFKNKIVAMSTHGRRGLNHLMMGSIAEDVVNHIECPIWTFTQK